MFEQSKEEFVVLDPRDGVGGAAFSVVGLSSLIPVIVFFSVGLVALVVGSLGSSGAVSKMSGVK